MIKFNWEGMGGQVIHEWYMLVAFKLSMVSHHFLYLKKVGQYDPRAKEQVSQFVDLDIMRQNNMMKYQSSQWMPHSGKYLVALSTCVRRKKPKNGNNIYQPYIYQPYI